MEVFINGKLNHSNNFFLTQRCKQYPNTNLNKYFLLDQYLKTTRETWTETQDFHHCIDTKVARFQLRTYLN